MPLVYPTYDGLPSKSAANSFSLTIEFDPLTEGPSRIFRSAASFSDGFFALDTAFAQAIDPSMETGLIVLGFEDGSLRTWMASILRSFDDDAIKNLDIKKLVGAYLVRAKHLSITWLEDDSSSRRVGDLEEQVLIEARNTDVLQIPAYHSPSRALLIDGLRRTQAAKELLDDGDRAAFKSVSGQVVLEAERGIDFTVLPDVEVSSKREFAINRASLVVKKPDMLGSSQWHVKFRDRTVRATIADKIWLAKYQGREVPLRPGDAIICDADFKILFDQTGTPISETVIVNKVHGLEFQPAPTDSMFG